jgi:hypothetical protein
MTNLLVALKNLVENNVEIITSMSKSASRANSMGDSLEIYIRDLFCGTLNCNQKDKELSYSKHFSYLGNQKIHRILL